MSKTFIYTKPTGHYYCQYSDDWEQDGIDFEYRIEDRELLEEVIPLIMEEYFGDDKEIFNNESAYSVVKARIKQIIDDNYLLDAFVDRYEETLKDIFYEEAIKAYDD